MPMRLTFSSFLLAVVGLGCNDSTGPGREDVAVLPEWVTGPAAAALDARNRFVFAPLSPGPDELSADEAHDIEGVLHIRGRESGQQSGRSRHLDRYRGERHPRWGAPVAHATDHFRQ